MMLPFVGGPLRRALPAPTSSSLSSRRVPRTTGDLTASDSPSAVAPPVNNNSPFAPLPDPSDPLFAPITNLEFETLTTLFHAAYRSARATMPWCGWITFMDTTALVVDPPGAPHNFPGPDKWHPQPAAFFDSFRALDAPSYDVSTVHLRWHFDFLFRTGSRTDLPPCAARLRRILQSPASAAVLARVGVATRPRTLCFTETGTTTLGLADLLRFAARLLFLIRTDPLGIPQDCATSLSRQYGSDDTDRRLGLQFPACPARRHARSALSLLASHLGNYTWQASPGPSPPANPLPVRFIYDRTLDVVEDCLRWAWHAMTVPSEAFPVPSRRQPAEPDYLGAWETLLAALCASLNPPRD
jgi:hypothetical protein